MAQTDAVSAVDGVQVTGQGMGNYTSQETIAGQEHNGTLRNQKAGMAMLAGIQKSGLVEDTGVSQWLAGHPIT